MESLSLLGPSYVPGHVAGPVWTKASLRLLTGCTELFTSYCIIQAVL